MRLYRARMGVPEPRWATVADAPVVAGLLHDFNQEFAAPSPGVPVLAARLRRLLPTSALAVLLAGDPAVGLAVVSFRPGVWSDGPTAMLEELYVVPEQRGRGIGSALMGRLLADVRAAGVQLVEILVDEPDVDAQRFYLRHGFVSGDGGSDDRALLFSQELRPPG